MFLHNFDDANVMWGDTLSNPLFLNYGQLMKFHIQVVPILVSSSELNNIIYDVIKNIS